MISCCHFLLLTVQFFIANEISSKRHFTSTIGNLLTPFPPCPLLCLLIFSCPSILLVIKVLPPGYPPLPLECHEFTLHNSDVCDAISLRYGWSPQNSLSNCVYASNTIEYTLSLSFPIRAFQTIHATQLCMRVDS